MSTPLRVLIVEDSEDDVLLVVRQLRRDGFTPTYERVDTPGAMAAALTRQEWDVVISDYVMPHFSAPDALALMKAHGFDLPFIILSGAVGEETAVEAMRAGASDFLVKSNLTRLCPAIEREMQEASNRRERRRAEAERAELMDQLQAQQALLESALQEMPAGVMLAEAPSGRLLFGNARMQQIWRHDFIPAEDVDEYQRYQGFYADGRAYQPREWPLARAVTAGEVTTNEEIEIVRGDRTRGVISVSAAPIRDRQGRLIAGVVTFSDVTERNRQEEHQRFLAEASAVLSGSLNYATTLAAVARLAVPTLGDWCIVDMIEEDGTLRRMAVAHLDEAKAEAVRTSGVGLHHAADATDGLPHVLRTGRPRLFPDVTEDLLPVVAGRPEHVELLRGIGLRSAMMAPLVARGRIIGIFSVFAAESERHYDASDLELVQDIAQRAAVAVDNARLYQQAQDAVRIRDEFLSSVSHDLRTPLTTIKGLAQLAARWVRRIETPDTARVLETMGSIDTSVTKMTALIDELLDVVRLQMGRPLELHLTPTDLVALACQQVKDHRQHVSNHQIDLHASALEVVGEWDGPRLERVMGNLLSNAIKYSPNGGTITVTVAHESVDGACPSGDEVGGHQRVGILRVDDQGVGIPATDLPHIFERFHRGANVTGRIAGNGIGLAGAKHIVEQHGGTIQIASEEGRGTSVTVRLPCG